MCCYIRQTTTKLALFSLHIILLCAQKVTGRITISPSLPEVNTRATISCYSVDAGRSWYHKGLYKASCNNQRCLPNADPQSGYTFTADNDKAQVTISSLDRARDGGLWMCSSGVNHNITLDVYSFPSGLSFTQGGDTVFDLAESQTILQCQTDGCMYPAPTIRWYFKDIAPSALLTFYKDTGTQVTGGICTSPEELYTSRLVLPLYTIWQDNIDKNVTLSCGIEYSDVSRNVYSRESKQIRYAVRVTEAIIQHNNQNITEILNVTAGVPIILTCLTRISRPPATIVWFLGSQTKGSGSIWNYTPSPADHNGIFYCQVYNTDQNQKIDSNKARLYVKVHIDSVMLRNGTALTLNEGQLAVLICETGACRPSAAIYWMKNGANITDSPTDVTVINQANDLFISMGTLHYTGKRGDNGKSLACGAFNGLDTGQTSGILIVTIYYPPESPPEIEGQVNGSRFTVIEHTSQSLVCRIIGGNPLANLSWICLGLIGISNTSGQIVVSEIVLALDRSAQDQRCTCQTSHPADTKMDVFVLLQVHFGAGIVNLSVNNDNTVNENSSVIFQCHVDSNPPSTITWMKESNSAVLKTETGVVRSQYRIESAHCLNMDNYTCSAYNGIRTPAKATIPLFVRCHPRTDYRLSHETTVYRRHYEAAVLRYTVISNPLPTFNWTFLGNGSESRYLPVSASQHDNGLQSELWFSSLGIDDFGKYSVIADNSLPPSAREIFEIIPAEVPEVPSNVMILEIMQTSVKLQWMAGNNGSLKQIFHVLVTGGSLIHNVTADEPGYRKNETVVLQGLVPKPKNSIYMKASNSVGSSNVTEAISITNLEAMTPDSSSTFSLPAVAGCIGAGVVVILLAVVALFLWRRYHHHSQHPDGTQRNQINAKSVRHDAADGQDYEGLHINNTEASAYLHLNDITLEENRNATSRPPENDSYEKLHPYTNNDIQMYSSLKIPKISKDSEKVYENTRITATDLTAEHQ